MVDITHPEGSKWWKWDLHCHTPMDRNWHNKPTSDKEKKKFVKTYLEKAKESELKVLAITDHFDYKDIKDSYLPNIQKEARNFDIIILPGFEITAKEGSGIHLNVIFPEDMNFYESVENLLTSFIKNTQNQPDRDKEIYSIILFEFEYYKRLVKSKFAEYSKYLGLTLGKSHDSRYKDDVAYITKSGNILVENGNLLYRDPEMVGSYERHAIGNARRLNKKEIPAIDNFFADLRKHWKNFYHKTFFRPNLKKKIDFNDFVVI